MKKGCIAVFAKTPGLSPLKTRLAEGIGREAAEDIFTACVDSIEATLTLFQKKHPEWDVAWALAEAQGKQNSFWSKRPFEKIWTGEGKLGTRLYSVDYTLKETYENVILIGTDCPHISLGVFDDALKFLSQNKMVVGPATDGGYYLFGSSFVIEQSIWEKVPYSCDDTLDIFLSLLDENVEKLIPLTDLDEQKEIKNLLQEITDLEIAIESELIYKLKDALN